MTKQLPDHTRRMSQMVNRPGGVTAEEAVAAAQSNIETIRERGLSDIAAAVHGMCELGEQSQCAELYRSSNALVGPAGVFGRSGLGEVALSLCTLIDRLSATGQWEQGAVNLHLDSLRLLSRGGAGEAEVATIAAALRQVVDRLQPVSVPARLN